MAVAKAEAAARLNGSSAQLAICCPAEKLMLTDGYSDYRRGAEVDDEEDEIDEETRASVRESLGSRWAKWGSKSSSKGKEDRRLKESWEDLHNG